MHLPDGIRLYIAHTEIRMIIGKTHLYTRGDSMVRDFQGRRPMKSQIIESPLLYTQ